MTLTLLQEFQGRFVDVTTEEDRLHVATAMIRAGLIELLKMNMPPDMEQARRYVEQFDNHTIHFMTRVRKETGVTRTREQAKRDMIRAQKYGITVEPVLGGEG